jgi:DNA polymerase III subunit chi
MAEVFFYHLTTSPLEHMLPQILDRSLQNNWRVVVRAGSKDQLIHLDERLWGGNNAQFLPHGVSGGGHDADQPILLTADAGNANGAKALMLVFGAKPTVEEVAKFERVSLIFNGNDEAAVDAARADWKTLTDAGIAAKYWSQASGRWEMKAEKNT